MDHGKEVRDGDSFAFSNNRSLRRWMADMLGSSGRVGDVYEKERIHTSVRQRDKGVYPSGAAEEVWNKITLSYSKMRLNQFCDNIGGNLRYSIQRLGANFCGDTLNAAPYAVVADIRQKIMALWREVSNLSKIQA